MKIDVKFSENNTEFLTDFEEVHEITKIVGETYSGDYVITPKADEIQKLETKEKYMYDDVTVKAIPYFETGNEYGGNTVYIGKEIE